MRGNGLAFALHGQLDGLCVRRVTHEPKRVVAEQDLAGARRLLQAGRHVDRVSRHQRATLPRDDRARVDADPHLEPKAVHDLAQLDRRTCRTQRIVLARRRDPEHRHHRIPDELLHRPAVPL